MDLKGQKKLAAQFKAVADDKAAVAKLADDSCAANPSDTDCHDLCSRFRSAADGGAVRAIADEIAARTS